MFVPLDTKGMQETNGTMPLFLKAPFETAQCLESAHFYKL